jgi:hypothetical protein
VGCFLGLAVSAASRAGVARPSLNVRHWADGPRPDRPVKTLAEGQTRIVASTVSRRSGRTLAELACSPLPDLGCPRLRNSAPGLRRDLPSDPSSSQASPAPPRLRRQRHRCSIGAALAAAMFHRHRSDWRRKLPEARVLPDDPVPRGSRAALAPSGTAATRSTGQTVSVASMTSRPRGPAWAELT